jgi:hypothetical protein
MAAINRGRMWAPPLVDGLSISRTLFARGRNGKSVIVLAGIDETHGGEARSINRGRAGV